MPEDETKKILEDIEKQGFPLEVKTSEVLKTRGWKVTNQVDYLDSEEKKLRTFDILAEKRLLPEYKSAFLALTKDLAVEIWLIVECKKSSKPWVFYTSEFNLNKSDVAQKVTSSMQLFVNSLTYQMKIDSEITDLMTEKFLYNCHYSSPIFGKLGTIPFEPFTKGEGRSLHKACMQVCNAILDLKTPISEATFKFPYGILFMPIVVLDGHLYSYENRKLNREDGIYYFMPYSDSFFMIQIVTEDFLVTYLDIIDEQIKKFSNE